MLQTTDGALVAVGDMMQRMRELSVQGASDTNVASDRTALQSEFTQLKSEIFRISKSTQWNGMNILDGSANGNTGSFNFQVGASAGQTVNQTIANMGFATGGGAAVSTAVSTTVATNKQVDTFTVTATGAAGDVLTFSTSKAQFQYTVLPSDVTGGVNTLAASIGTAMGLANGSQPSFASIHGAGATSSGATFKLTATADNGTFDHATNTVASGGSLANINDLTVSDQVHATMSIASMDNAIATVNSTRSGLGAMINRLTYAADNLANVSQNAQASRSRIQDTDYAKTSTELARTQIISQAATAMLAQANQSQQSVLAFLK
jgi:flagellin